MCIICDGLSDNKLTPWEAAKNRTEMIEAIEDDHHEELDRKIREATLRYIMERGDFPVKPPKAKPSMVGVGYSD